MLLRMEVSFLGIKSMQSLLLMEVGSSCQHRQMLEAIASIDHAFYCKRVHDELVRGCIHVIVKENGSIDFMVAPDVCAIGDDQSATCLPV